MNLPETLEIKSPESLSEVFEFLSNGLPLAGGTDLIVKIKSNKISPNCLVSLKNIRELKSKININNQNIEITALTTHKEIAKSELIKKHAPVLSMAASEVGSPQIRNMGTIGGNIVNSSPAGDVLTALFALNARLVLCSREGERTIDIRDFMKGPGKTDLKKGEILKKIIFKVKSHNISAYKKLGQRSALSIAKVSVAVHGKIENNKIEFINIACGAVAPVIIKPLKVENFLKEKKLTPEILNQASKLLMDEINPINDIRSNAEYRRKMCIEIFKRLLLGEPFIENVIHELNF